MLQLCCKPIISTVAAPVATQSQHSCSSFQHSETSQMFTKRKVIGTSVIECHTTLRRALWDDVIAKFDHFWNVSVCSTVAAQLQHRCSTNTEFAALLEPGWFFTDQWRKHKSWYESEWNLDAWLPVVTKISYFEKAGFLWVKKNQVWRMDWASPLRDTRLKELIYTQEVRTILSKCCPGWLGLAFMTSYLQILT